MLRLVFVCVFLLAQSLGILHRADASVEVRTDRDRSEILYIDISDDYACGLGEKSEKQVVSRSKRVEFRSKIRSTVAVPTSGVRPSVAVKRGFVLASQRCLRYPEVVSLCNLRL